MGLNTLVRGAHALRTAQDYVKLPGYYADTEAAPTSTVREYQNEKDFWYEALGYRKDAEPPRAGDAVTLTKFRLSEWVPRVPGLYWKDESLKLRDGARFETLQTDHRFAIYSPAGKTMHILGGVGNVRLLPSGQSQLLCASSSGEYWRGVPVLLEGEAFQEYRDAPDGIVVSLEGRWRPLPAEYARQLGSNAGIPRYCLVIDAADHVTVLNDGSSWSWKCQSSAWTLFEYRGEDNLPRYDFAYCIFRAFRSKTGHLEEATYFIRDYVERRHGTVLTDFDQEIPQFDAWLPINELMSREVDPRRLRALVNRVKEGALSPERVQYETLPSVLMDHFNIEELRILAVDYLALDLEDLVGPSAGKVDHVQALVDFCDEQERTADLVAGAIQQRQEAAEELMIEA
jgi:hypothetical protein